MYGTKGKFKVLHFAKSDRWNNASLLSYIPFRLDYLKDQGIIVNNQGFDLEWKTCVKHENCISK